MNAATNFEMNLYIENLTKHKLSGWYNASTIEELNEIMDGTEWIVADTETSFISLGYEISRMSSVDLIDMVDTMNNLDTFELEQVELATSIGFRFDEALELIEDGNIYIYDGFSSEEDAVAEFLDEVDFFHNVPDIVKTYFDYEKYTRDLRYEGWRVEKLYGKDAVVMVAPR